MYKLKNKGFTLVELIVVIIILAILVGVTIGGIYMYIGKARIATDKNNMNSLNDTLQTSILLDDTFEEITERDSTVTNYRADGSVQSRILYPKLVFMSWSDEVTLDTRSLSTGYNTIPNILYCYTDGFNAEELNYIYKVLCSWNDGVLPASKTGNVYCLYIAGGTGTTDDSIYAEDTELRCKCSIVDKEYYNTKIKNKSFSDLVYKHSKYEDYTDENGHLKQRFYWEDAEVFPPFYED